MREPGMKTFGVLRSLAPTFANDDAQGQRHVGAPAGDEAPGRDPVGQRIRGVAHRIETLMHQHRTKPRNRCTQRHGGQALLGDRSVEHALRTEAIDKTRGAPKYPTLAVGADAIHEDGFVEFQRLTQGLVDRLAEAQFAGAAAGVGFIWWHGDQYGFNRVSAWRLSMPPRPHARIP